MSRDARAQDTLLSMVANLPAAAVYRDGHKLYLNPAVEKIIGYSRTEIATLDHWFTKLYGRRSASVRDLYEQDRRAGFPASRTTPMRRKDGDTRVVEFAAYGHDGGEVWLLRDVTERHTAREELQQAVARTQAILDSAVDGIITMDESGIIESVNPSAEVMFGYAAEEIIGRNVTVLMPAPFREEHDEYLRRYLETGRRKIIGIGREVIGRRKGGALFPIDLAVSEFFHGTGRSFVGTLRDITERKEIERALRRERDFAESLIETAPAIVLVLDTEGRIVRFNHYMEKISGYSLDEVRGASWFPTFLPERDQPRILDVFTRVLEEESTQGAVNPIVTKSGVERQIEWYNTLLRDSEGEVTGILSVGQDITERRRLEEQFRQAQKMEAVGRLAGGVAHDFNTLLGTFTGYSEMLLDGLRASDPLRRAAEQIHRGADRGAALTRQLLAFSRRQVLEPKVLDLNAVLDDMDDMLERLIGANVAIRRTAAPDLGRVRVDAGGIEQVIMNLIVNACDAMPRGGRIVLETRNVELDDDAFDEIGAGPYVLLKVSDTGCGMDEETRTHLFEPFFTTKARGKGTGLGLSTVFGIVKQSDGAISVESRTGKGTTFRIYLPRWRGEPAREEPPRQEAGPTAGAETVLLAEDDEMFRDLLSEVLAAQGYRVLTAAEATHALAACDEYEGEVHLLVSDLVMPGGVTGNELAERLTLRYPELKVILMSGYSDDDLADRRPGGFEGHFLQKPFSTRDFLRTVRRTLDVSTGAGKE